MVPRKQGICDTHNTSCFFLKAHNWKSVLGLV